MGHLGLTHDWSTIQAIHDAVGKDGRCLQVARGGTGAVARRRRGRDRRRVPRRRAGRPRPGHRGRRRVGVLGPGQRRCHRQRRDRPDTLRGESDRIALLDGQPVPGQIGREVAQYATWWRRLVTDPVDGHLLDYGRTTYLPEKLRRFVLARERCLPRPVLHEPGRVPHADGPRRGVPARSERRSQLRADSARPATSSRPPATPTSPTPGPTAPAPGSPPGARPSTSPSDPSSRSTRIHHPCNRNHRHPTTRHRSDPTQFVGLQACSGDAVIPGVDHDLDPVP